MTTETVQITQDELLERFRAAATGDPKDARGFFVHLGFMQHYKDGDYLSFFDAAVSMLAELRALDPDAYKRIHKGYPFYFLAISAFLMHDSQAATYFFDATAAEDVKNDNDAQAPGRLFMVMDGQNPKQAAQELTKVLESALRATVIQYNGRAGAVSITVEQIRDCLLKQAVIGQPEWRTLVTSWMSFLLEADHLIRLLATRADDGTWGLFYEHLFRGCLLFESLLKSEPSGQTSEPTLGAILNSPKSYARSKLGITRRLETSGPTLSDIVRDIAAPRDDIQADIELTARLRNTLGHNLGWGQRIAMAQYIDFANTISNACLHAVSALYR